MSGGVDVGMIMPQLAQGLNLVGTLDAPLNSYSYCIDTNQRQRAQFFVPKTTDIESMAHQALKPKF